MVSVWLELCLSGYVSFGTDEFEFRGQGQGGHSFLRPAGFARTTAALQKLFLQAILKPNTHTCGERRWALRPAPTRASRGVIRDDDMAETPTTGRGDGSH